MDVGSASQMDDLSRIPGAVAEMLGAIRRLQLMLEPMPASLPMPLRSGLSFLAGGRLNQWQDQVAETAGLLGELQSAMASLATHVEKSARLLCVDGAAEVATAERLARRLSPHLTLFTGGGDGVPSWSHGPSATWSDASAQPGFERDDAENQGATDHVLLAMNCRSVPSHFLPSWGGSLDTPQGFGYHQ